MTDSPSGLAAERGAGAAEGDPVGAHPGEGDERRAVAPDPAVEMTGASPQLGVVEFGGRCRRPVHEVRDADAVLKEVAIFERGELALGEPGPMQDLPEPVAGPGEVVTDGAGVQARVDAAEQDA
jgi:hypothetical protein